MKTVLSTIVIMIVLVAVCGLVVIYSGLYNVGASEPHTGLMKWVLSTTSDHSVAAHAKRITAPKLTDTSMILTGFAHYDEMCVGCHGAPGRKRDEFVEGLNPRPPSLVASVDDWSDSELFWITKNGYKMTGMPGFGVNHSDQQIWDIVAFLRKLPDLDGAQYDAMARRAQAAGVMELDDDDEGKAEAGDMPKP